MQLKWSVIAGGWSFLLYFRKGWGCIIWYLTKGVGLVAWHIAEKCKLHNLILYSGKILREKTFEVLWPFAKVSRWNLGVWHPLTTWASNSRKFSPSKVFLLYGILTKGEGYISQYTAEGGGAGYFDRLLTNFYVLVCLCPSTTWSILNSNKQSPPHLVQDWVFNWRMPSTRSWWGAE